MQNPPVRCASMMLELMAAADLCLQTMEAIVLAWQTIRQLERDLDQS
jgi:hypothetical protein